MLDRVVKALIDAQTSHALDSIARPYGERIEYEAGRRQGIYQGLNLALSKVEELIRGEEDDEAGRGGKAVRRAL